MAKQDDSLFLLEVLVDKVVFLKSPCFTDKDFRTCVNIQCPAVDPLEICDDDPTACFAKSGGPFVKTFNNGKSCLFSLKESDISSAMSKFPVKVTVYKALPCGCLPTKIIMGEATIDMTKEFVQARKKFLEDSSGVSYQALQDSFRIMDTAGVESGEILMYLRISCFGKLIITRFQGAGGPPTLGGSAGGSIVDSSCNPRKDYQSTDDPCACGGSRGVPGGKGAGAGGQPCSGGGRGVCPIARDTYNSMPCIDGDDMCYCSGPKPDQKVPMACRNTDQYCLHVPKGVLPSLPFYQELTEDQKLDIKKSYRAMEQYTDKYNMAELDINKFLNAPIMDNITQYLKILRSVKPTLRYVKKTSSTNSLSISSYDTFSTKDVKNTTWMSMVKPSSLYDDSSKHNLFLENDTFGQNETTVYMTYIDEFRHRTSGTQATASINKCFQVQLSNNPSVYCPSRCESNLDAQSYAMSSTFKESNNSKKSVPDNIQYSKVYSWGEKDNGMGMGGSKFIGNNRYRHLTEIQAMPCTAPPCTTGAQTKAVEGYCASTSTGKAVSIKEERSPCPAMGISKGDMVATISHIRLGPKEPCPVHGGSPCQGPKCMIASTGDQEVPVKVSTASNPRRGVFELVIRRLNGAPLAKNELMLEWTPPPPRPPCGGVPCSHSPCPPGPCRSKCKIIVCRPSPCKPKICRKTCKRPCRPVPCRSVPSKPRCKPCPPSPCRPCSPPKCDRCGSGCCGRCPSEWPCRPLPPWRFKTCASPCTLCKPCGPSPCRSCGSCKPCTSRPCRRPSPCCRPCRPPSPLKIACPSVCCKRPCSSPCRSSPCLPPCPRRRKCPRKSRSSPKMKGRRKRTSPCCNRTKTCPVVRCRSLPGPCVMCCNILRCPPRKCCSVAPCKALTCKG